MKTKDLPLVYACSGCSNVAQLANQVAVKMDRQGLAEMSCIAGVGGDVPKLVKLAKSGRRIIALDGCALACARHSLARHGVSPDDYHQLGEYGYRKRYHTDFEPDDAEALMHRIIARSGGEPSVTEEPDAEAPGPKVAPEPG